MLSQCCYELVCVLCSGHTLNKGRTCVHASLRDLPGHTSKGRRTWSGTKRTLTLPTTAWGITENLVGPKR